jgi:RNA polymerase sigma factor (sigma-70 family)
MMGSDTALQDCLDRLRLGDPTARQRLLQSSQGRLRLLTRRMLRKYPGVRRWEETDDVLQGVLVRLDRLLHEVPVAAVLDYLRLASVNIRRELIDLARRHRDRAGTSPRPAAVDAPEDAANDPGCLEAWAAFHDEIGRLPQAERAVFGLLWYQGLTQPEAAALLRVSVSTVKRRWLVARVRLLEALGDERPS